jgi:hypothetical protein
VDLLDDYYDDYWFRVASYRVFSVSDSFPAIRASELSRGVSSVEYSVDLSILPTFELTDWQS